MTLGAQLKTAREKKGYTLKQLSEISGLSIGFISQVERGQTDPSLSSLKNLATALDLKLRDLFDPDEAAHVLVRRGEGNMLKIDAKVQCELLASSLTKTMEPMIKSIMPGGESGLVSAHAGEEFAGIVFVKVFHRSSMCLRVCFKCSWTKLFTFWKRATACIFKQIRPTHGKMSATRSALQCG